jgi:hypothetical protein
MLVTTVADMLLLAHAAGRVLHAAVFRLTQVLTQVLSKLASRGCCSSGAWVRPLLLLLLGCGWGQRPPGP